jgi:predicted RNA methylase
MSRSNGNADKDRYRELRQLSWERLWNVEVPSFNRADPMERVANVALIRAVGVVFSESGDPARHSDVKRWLRSLLDDPHEKIRRYAIAALPKIGADGEDEKCLLRLFERPLNDREKKFLAEALEKIGGEQTLAVADGLSLQTKQKALASVARGQNAGSVQNGHLLESFQGLKIHFRTRRGLEAFVLEEVRANPKLRVVSHEMGLVIAEPSEPFSLNDLHAVRCCGTVSFCPGARSATMDDLSSQITSPAALQILRSLTSGPIRYRLDFVSKGHQRAAVKHLANLIFSRCPEILNDARAALWSVDIRSNDRGDLVEFRARIKPDPRFAYRVKDIPAASHPPLAACMARLADRQPEEMVWDPFCGSGTELIECAFFGGIQSLHGTDLSAEALNAAITNWSAAGLGSPPPEFVRCDFRDYRNCTKIQPGSLSLIITNPPLGMRIPIANLRELIADLFEVAAEALRPDGRFVVINPIKTGSPSHPALHRQFHQQVDMSGYDCALEKYVKR